jgi:hypothetical protein
MKLLSSWVLIKRPLYSASGLDAVVVAAGPEAGPAGGTAVILSPQATPIPFGEHSLVRDADLIFDGAPRAGWQLVSLVEDACGYRAVRAQDGETFAVIPDVGIEVDDHLLIHRDEIVAVLEEP